jgi:signal transduction histidine kinase
VTATSVVLVVLCAITLYLAATVQQYVFERRREAGKLQDLLKSVLAPKNVIMMPSEPEVHSLVETIHDTAEQAKAITDEALENGVGK